MFSTNSNLDSFMAVGFLNRGTLRVNGFSQEGSNFIIKIQGNLKSKDIYSELQGGFEISITDLLNLIMKGNVKEVEIKGGEPYLQSANLGILAKELGCKNIDFKVYSFMEEKEIEKASQYNRFIKRLYESSNFRKNMDNLEKRGNVIRFNCLENHISFKK